MPRKKPTTVWNLRRGGFANLPGHRKAPDYKYLEVEDFRKLLAVCRADDGPHASTAYDLFAFAGNFGLRCVECLRATPDDFKTLRQNYFTVHSAKKGAIVDEPLYVGDQERDFLVKMVERRSNKARRSSWSEHLFDLPERSVRHLFAWYMNLARLSPHVSFHALRHVACKLIRGAAGNNDLYCAVRLRHTIKSVTGGYARPTRNEMIAAANVKGMVL